MRSEETFMSANGCCKIVAREAARDMTEKRIFGSNPPKPTLVRRFLENAGWIVPGATLALLPKCPACVATYAVIGTGVGLSLSATTYLRALLVVLCVTSLSYLVARRMRRFHHDGLRNARKEQI
jgi:Flp pilus assembly protein TadB